MIFHKMFHIGKYHFVNLASQHIVVKICIIVFHILIFLLFYILQSKNWMPFIPHNIESCYKHMFNLYPCLANLSFHAYQTIFLLLFSKYSKDIVICEHKYFLHYLHKLLLTNKDVSLDHHHHDTMVIEFSKHFQLVPPSLKILLQL